MIHKKQRLRQKYSSSEHVELGQKKLLLQDMGDAGVANRRNTTSFQERINQMNDNELSQLRDQLVEKVSQNMASDVDIYMDKLDQVKQLTKARQEAINESKTILPRIDSADDIAIRDVRAIIDSDSFEKIVRGEVINNILVAQLQNSLKILNYDLGNTGVLKDGVDGFYNVGGKTAKAVEQFKVDQSIKENLLEARPSKKEFQIGV